MRVRSPLLGLLLAVLPTQAAGYGEHGLQRNIPQERAREAYKVERARGEERMELLREQGHPRHRRPGDTRPEGREDRRR